MGVVHERCKREALLGHFDVSGVHSGGRNEAKFIFTSGGSIGDGNIDQDSDERLEFRV